MTMLRVHGTPPAALYVEGRTLNAPSLAEVIMAKYLAFVHALRPCSLRSLQASWRYHCHSCTLEYPRMLPQQRDLSFELEPGHLHERRQH